MSEVRTIEVLDSGLMIVDAERRVYAAESRDGTYLHVIRPLWSDDPAVTTEGSLVRAGELTCCCAGGTFRNQCYRLDQAREYESAADDWFGIPARTEAVPA